MPVEDLLLDSLKNVAFHPSAFFYAWKKTNLEKLFDEFLKSNIAVISVEAITVDEKVLRTIPLKNGQIELFEWKSQSQKGEEWYDFVERVNKEVIETINYWNLEKESRSDLRGKIWYHFELKAE